MQNDFREAQKNLQEQYGYAMGLKGMFSGLGKNKNLTKQQQFEARAAKRLAKAGVEDGLAVSDE